MSKEIYIHCFLKSFDFNKLKGVISELNIQQDIIFFQLVDKKIKKEGTTFELSEFYSNITYKIKKEFTLPNLITITDAEVFCKETELSIGTHFANSYQIGVVQLKKQATISILKYEIMRQAIQISLNRYFGHRNEGCFFDEDTNIYNIKLCDFCIQELKSLGFQEKDLIRLTKFLNTVKNEYMGIQESNLFSVIIMDIVSYSQYTDSQQKRMIEILQSVIKENEMINRNLENIIFLPTGDGCVIALHDSFYRFTVKLCANLQQAMNSVGLDVRFGLNFGSVFKYRDLNDNINIAGSGINMAARVMDVGDGNHIIANRTIYDNLGNLDDWHRDLFHNLGKIKVKHGVELDVFNVYSEQEKFGRADIPKKLKR